MDQFTDLHAMVVHFPIALLFVSVGLEAASLHPKLRSHLSVAALITLVLGTIGAAVAVFTGPEDNARGVTRLMHVHEQWAQSTLILFGVLVLWRLFTVWKRREHTGVAAVGFVLLGLVGLGMLGYTGYLGGQMVYREAVGVQRNGAMVAPPVRGQFHGGQGAQAPGAPGQ